MRQKNKMAFILIIGLFISSSIVTLIVGYFAMKNAKYEDKI